MSVLVTPTRRHFLKLAAATPVLSVPGIARASITAPDGGNTGHYRFDFGDAKVTVISDGFFTRPLSAMAVNASEEEKLAFVTEYFQSDHGLPPLSGPNQLLVHDEPPIHRDDAFRSWWTVSESTVRTNGVVMDTPLLDEDLRLAE